MNHLVMELGQIQKEKEMTEKEMVYTASYAIGKNLDFETLMYSDEMYNKEEETEDVWVYVLEAKEIGSSAFKEKYKECKFYWAF